MPFSYIKKKKKIINVFIYSYVPQEHGLFSNKSRLITNTIFLYEVIGITYIKLFCLFSNNYLYFFKL